MKHYQISVSNQELGPLSETEVIDLIKRGYIPPIARCKILGEDRWYSIKEIEAFEKCLKLLDVSWDEDTVIHKIIALDSINDKIEKKEITLKTIETNKTRRKVETTSLKTKENFDLEKTIISPQTKRYLKEEEIKKTANKPPQTENIPLSEVPRKAMVLSTDKTVQINRNEYLPENLVANEHKVEEEWQKIKSEEKIKKKKIEKKKEKWLNCHNYHGFTFSNNAITR